MIFTTTGTQHCSIEGQRHGNEKLCRLLIIGNDCSSNYCSGPTMMLEKERTEEKSTIIDISSPSCTTQ